MSSIDITSYMLLAPSHKVTTPQWHVLLFQLLLYQIRETFLLCLVQTPLAGWVSNIVLHISHLRLP